jgi:molybdopterin-guanine dinucleotide biosynthesis protein A
MGKDKGALDYRGKPHREFTADLIAPRCDKTFLSCRGDQVDSIDSSYELLADSFLELGPYGAMLSAFRVNPNVAWLVLACDLPLIDEATIEHLIASRDPQRTATAFRNVHDGFPEPLITIWEPRSYPTLLGYLGQGRCCPRKVLINADVQLLDPPVPDALENANAPEDLERLKPQA